MSKNRITALSRWPASLLGQIERADDEIVFCEAMVLAGCGCREIFARANRAFKIHDAAQRELARAKRNRY